jgi:SAM-dependent methyltransferase
MKECSKSIPRRLSDPNFARRYFIGVGLDIGGKPDPLALYSHLFSQIQSVQTWDWEDGDAQMLEGVPADAFDFVHSSHCLEHLIDPTVGIRNWMRVLKPGGHLVITVPDEDLYEQGIFPSTFNSDHKWTFTIFKKISWSSRSINILDLVRSAGENFELLRIEQLSNMYRFDLPRYDQTLAPVGEIGIEFIIRKRFTEEMEVGGRWNRNTQQPSNEIRLHLNQYSDDQKTLRQKNSTITPFLNNNTI